MSNEVYVGVDGGGTKTKIIACNNLEEIVLEKSID